MGTLYDILGVDPKAKSGALRHAYRKLARAYHPDVSDDPKAHERMAEINSAFATLIDPARRMEYDASLGGELFEAPVQESRAARIPEILSVRILHRLKQHRTPIYGLSFAPDSNQLVSSSFDNEVLWYDPETYEVVRRIKLEGGVVSTVRALPNDRVVAAGSSESIVSVWVLDGDHVDTWRNSPLEWVSCVGVSGDGRNVAMGSVYHTLQVCRSRSGDAVFAGTGHSQSVTAVAWSNDGRFVATGSADATVKLWSGVSGRELHTFQSVRSTVTSLAFSPAMDMLAVASVDNSLRIFELNSLTLSKTFFGHEKPIEAISFHPSGLLLGSVSRDGSVGLWNVVQGQGHIKIAASPQPLSNLAFSPDGRKLAAGGLDRVLRVWDLQFYTQRSEGLAN